MSEAAKKDEAVQEAPKEEQTAYWYVHKDGENYGPFVRKQILHLIKTKQVDKNCHLYNTETEEWRPIVEYIEMLADRPQRANASGSNERRIGAPRAELSGNIKLWRDGNESPEPMLEGVAKDISVSGVFLLTASTILKIGDMVRVQIVSEEMDKKVIAVAKVVRHSASKERGFGYGLHFTQIDAESAGVISRRVGIRPISEFGEVFSHTAVSLK